MYCVSHTAISLKHIYETNEEKNATDLEIFDANRGKGVKRERMPTETPLHVKVEE